jgi:hypothetical protein
MLYTLRRSIETAVDTRLWEAVASASGSRGAKWVGDGPEIVSPKLTSVGYGSRPPAWFTVTPYPKCANDDHPRADYSGPLSLR